MMFNESFDRVFTNEGLFQDDPNDRGNWTSGRVGEGELKGTKFGLAAMTYPDLDIRNLTKAEAKEIYYRDWWLALDMQRFRSAMQYQMFDAAINHGMHNATKMLQRAAHAVDDGIIGPNTWRRVTHMDLNDLLLRFLAYRLDFMAQITTWKHYGKGWARRIAHNLLLAAEDN